MQSKNTLHEKTEQTGKFYADELQTRLVELREMVVTSLISLSLVAGAVSYVRTTAELTVLEGGG